MARDVFDTQSPWHEILASAVWMAAPRPEAGSVSSTRIESTGAELEDEDWATQATMASYNE